MVVCLLGTLACAGLALSSYAQSVEIDPADLPSAQAPSPSARAKAGVHLVRKGNPDSARSYLRRALAADSALVLPNHGAVAYWLGETYARTDSLSGARATWRDGIRALRSSDRFDVRLADAYLRTLSLNHLRSERLQAVEDYRSLLGAVGPGAPPALDSIFRRRVAQLEPLLPDDVFADVVDGSREAESSTWTFREGAGEALQAWWRGLDPLPDTPENERLEEHVTRLVRAQRSFRCEDPRHNLDDRGIVHLRLGAPYKQRDLKYKDYDFFDDVYRFGVPVPASGFPEGEIWLYPQIDESSYYLFVEGETSGCYNIAKANDLLPKSLRWTRGNSDRGLNIAYSSLMALRAIYEELSLYHIDYGGRYSEIANYADYQEMQAVAAQMGASSGTKRQTQVGAGIGQTRIVTSDPAFGIDAPTQFVRRLVTRAEREDERAAERRREVTPRHRTALESETPSLPVAVRTARFLTSDGTTRTDVYWGVRGRDVMLRDATDDQSAPSAIRFSAVQAGPEQIPKQRISQRHTLAPGRFDTNSVLVPSAARFSGTTSNPYHLRFRWAQHRLWQSEDGSVAGLGPKRRVTFARVDSLRPLHADGRHLEMSDLKVLTLPDTSAATLTNPPEHGHPYPFRAITSDMPLALMFEVYHLTFGDDDQTRYTLSYEVEGETRRGWTRLFRGQETQRTRTEMTVEGTARRSEETILLDLSEIDQEEEQSIRVTVRVTDEVTGETRSRTADFVLDASGAPE